MSQERQDLLLLGDKQGKAAYLQQDPGNHKVRRQHFQAALFDRTRYGLHHLVTSGFESLAHCTNMLYQWTIPGSHSSAYISSKVKGSNETREV